MDNKQDDGLVKRRCWAQHSATSRRSAHLVAVLHAEMYDYKGRARLQTAMNLDCHGKALVAWHEMKRQQARRSIERLGHGDVLNVSMMQRYTGFQSAHAALSEVQHCRTRIDPVEMPTRVGSRKVFQLQSSTCCDDQHPGVVTHTFSQQNLRHGHDAVVAGNIASRALGVLGNCFRILKCAMGCITHRVMMAQLTSIEGSASPTAITSSTTRPDFARWQRQPCRGVFRKFQWSNRPFAHVECARAATCLIAKSASKTSPRTIPTAPAAAPAPPGPCLRAALPAPTARRCARPSLAAPGPTCGSQPPRCAGHGRRF